MAIACALPLPWAPEPLSPHLDRHNAMVSRGHEITPFSDGLASRTAGDVDTEGWPRLVFFVMLILIIFNYVVNVHIIEQMYTMIKSMHIVAVFM